MKNLNYKRNSE